MMYCLGMQMPEPHHDPELWAKFKNEIELDLSHADLESNSPSRILAACQDTQSQIYLLVMAVPPTALDDGIGPDLWRTPDKHKFIVCLNQELLFEKAEELTKEHENLTSENANRFMTEFIAEFLPAMFERASEMEPLDI